jgi:hypothetical protein
VPVFWTLFDEVRCRYFRYARLFHDPPLALPLPHPRQRDQVQVPSSNLLLGRARLPLPVLNDLEDRQLLVDVQPLERTFAQGCRGELVAESAGRKGEIGRREWGSFGKLAVALASREDRVGRGTANLKECLGRKESTGSWRRSD